MNVKRKGADFVDRQGFAGAAPHEGTAFRVKVCPRREKTEEGDPAEAGKRHEDLFPG